MAERKYVDIFAAAALIVASLAQPVLAQQAPAAPAIPRPVAPVAPAPVAPVPVVPAPVVPAPVAPTPVAPAPAAPVAPAPAAAAQPAQPAAATAQKRVMPRELMTATERQAFRASMRAARTHEERMTLRTQKMAELRARAAARGMVLAERPYKPMGPGAERSAEPRPAETRPLPPRAP